MSQIILAIFLSLVAAAPPGAIASNGNDHESARSQFAGRRTPSRNIRLARHKGRNLAERSGIRVANNVRDRDEYHRAVKERP